MDLKTQNAFGIRPDGSCTYLNAQGHSCAFGLVLKRHTNVPLQNLYGSAHHVMSRGAHRGALSQALGQPIGHQDVKDFGTLQILHDAAARRNADHQESLRDSILAIAAGWLKNPEFQHAHPIAQLAQEVFQ